MAFPGAQIRSPEGRNRISEKFLGLQGLPVLAIGLPESSEPDPEPAGPPENGLRPQIRIGPPETGFPIREGQNNF